MRYIYSRRKSARRRQRIRLAAQAGLIAAAILAWSAATAGTLDLTVRNGFVTMDSLAVPLGDVLRDMSKKAGFRLVMKKDLRAPVTWSFHDVPVDEAVTRLLARVSSVALYAPAGDGGGRLLTEVRVLRGGDDDMPLVERRDARFELPDAGTPTHLQMASAAGLQPASGAAAPEGRAVAALPAANRHSSAPRAVKGRPDTGRAALNAALSDPDTVARQRGVQGLIRLGGEESVTSLSRVLLEDPAPRVRTMAAAGLGRMSTESAFWALMEASSDNDPGVREAVSDALLRLERRGVNKS